MGDTGRTKPTTFQSDLAKLPQALAPLIERRQWAGWRWTLQANGIWQKPPFVSTQPERHASVSDPSTWSNYTAALAAVQAGAADGITYILAETDPFGAIDLDYCRDATSGSIDAWAQNHLDTGRHTYAEITPSGSGCRLWGFASGNALHKHYSLVIDGKQVGVELFRRTNKALTVTGLELGHVRELANIDKALEWGAVWAERRKAAATEAAAPVSDGFNGGGNGYSVDQVEAIARGGAPAGENRSDTFHAVIGHYAGCGWTVEQILDHLQQFPDGIGGRYLAEGRLDKEIERSVDKFSGGLLPVFINGFANGHKIEIPSSEELIELRQRLQDPSPSPSEPPQQDPHLPAMFAHGDPDPRPLARWLIKGLVPAIGHGLLSGQWATGKTFVALDLAAALGTGQPFLGHVVKRQCGTLLIAAEGAGEVRLRLDAVVQEKCGGLQRAPICWYETAPALLHKGSVETLIGMCRQADASLTREFGLKLGLVVVDTIAACAGYARAGDENDPAAGQAVMNVLRTVAQAIGCFVLGVDHFGKSLEAGTRGASSKEASADLVLACLGAKQLSGSVTDLRVAVRKNRGGPAGKEFPFVLRAVAAPEPDEDGEPVHTMVVDWRPASPSGSSQEPDPWVASRREDQRTAAARLRRVLMETLAEHGVELPIEQDGPPVRVIAQELVRDRFYQHTPAEGTPKQKGHYRRQKFLRALDWAADRHLVVAHEIDGAAYLRLGRPNQDAAEDEEDD